jgi:hypothetical protein
MTRFLSGCFIAVFLAASSMTAGAVILHVRGGILYGASNVPVEGKLYDVEFVDGTCAALFNACDDPTDFQFHTAESGALASRVLLDLLLDDNVFDYHPELINGCRFHGVGEPCMILTPISPDIPWPGTEPPGRYFLAAWAQNGGHWWDPFSGCCVGYSTFMDTAYEPYVFARWTAAPEPVTITLLLAAGLAWLGLQRRGVTQPR